MHRTTATRNRPVGHIRAAAPRLWVRARCEVVFGDVDVAAIPVLEPGLPKLAEEGVVGSAETVFSSQGHLLPSSGLMLGLTCLNGHDEGMHTDFACMLFSHLRCRPHPETIKHIGTEAVAIEQEF